ncbi:uncharacterized protein RJT21DRAFT_1250 [Scheffersomyces amazonensis]|uniref:uncharacterized protein n=1 Tax=Scheffersomyces amazonensis TaxID=1078765 RepID=UPI00315C6B76
MAIISSCFHIVLSPLIFVIQLLLRIFWSGLNERSIIGLVLNFWINFSPVFIWLLIFKNAGLIPKKIRPRIFVKFAYRTENLLFNLIEHPIINALFVFVLTAGSYLLYSKIYRSIGTINVPSQSSVTYQIIAEDEIESPSYELEPISGSDSTKSLSLTPSFSSGDTSLELSQFNYDQNISTETLHGRSEDEEEQVSQFMDLIYFKHRKYTPNNTKLQLIINTRKNLQSSNPYRPLNCWYLSSPAILASSWFLLNLAYAFREPIKTYKDIIAWFLYVICHFCAPLFTAIWLYVFHAPGSLKLFSIGLGVQNICGVMTHLLFPNAPPWFIHLYGENKEANYDMPGYAAGLTRVDVAMGTHLHSKGFHISPIVFGALPSVHSAMAVMVFFFLSYYSRWYSIKIIGLCFVILQWWATIYLDHHWRLDLIVGMAYSIIVFTILLRWIKRYDERFIKKRLKGERLGSETMGMRVFKNTCIEFFFDPLNLK